MCKWTKYLISGFVAFIFLALATPAFLQPVTGTWTPNNWLFQQGIGDKGPAAKTNVDTGLNQLDARLSYEVYVTDPKYGAKGDGVTDDTAAIQAALNSGIKRVVFPAPTSFYKITSPLTVSKPAIEIIGLGNAVTPESMNTLSAVSIKAAAAMTYMFYLNNTGGSDTTGLGFSIRNVKLDGNGLAQYGVYNANARYWKSQGCCYANFTISNGWGLWAGGSSSTAWSGRLTDMNYFYNCANGAYLKGDNMVADGNIFENITGIALEQDATWCNFSATRNKFDGCITGIQVNAAWSLELNNNYFESHGTATTHIRLGQAGVNGMIIQGGSVVNNMLSFEGSFATTNIGVDIQQIQNVNFFGNYGSTACGYLFKNNTGGASNGSFIGINFINVPSSTTYIDSLGGFALVLDNSGNILTPLNSTSTNGGKFAGNLGVTQSTSTNWILSGQVSGDTNARAYMTAAGEYHAGGNGTAAAPTVINGDGTMAPITTNYNYNLGSGAYGNGYYGTHNDNTASSNSHYLVGLRELMTANPGSGITNSGYVYGGKLESYHAGSGTEATLAALTLGYGTYNAGSDSTGTITTAYGLSIFGNKTNSSMITTNYGLYVAGVFGTIPYDIYAADTGAKNYFAGPVNLANRLNLAALSAAPSSPAAGDIVRADRVNWDPLSKGSGGSYLVWYDGSAWVSLTSQ